MKKTLKRILSEDIKQFKKSDLEFNVNQKTLINNVINNFNTEPFKKQFIDFKKKFEELFLESLFQYVKENLSINATEDDIKQVLYNLDIECNMQLFKNATINFDTNSFVDELESVIQNKVG